MDNHTDPLDTTEEEWAKAIAEAGAPTEKELRESSIPAPKTMEELHSYIDSLVDRPHDYGTCVYAMSLSALAAFNYIASKLGVTGFQAGCAEIEFISRSRRWECGGAVIDYSNLLWPQYSESISGFRELVYHAAPQLVDKAQELLSQHPDSWAADWWRSIISLAAFKQSYEKEPE